MSQQARAAARRLSFSRDQEYQADMLGTALSDRGRLRSGRRARRPRRADPRHGAQARIQGRDNRQTPEWASTHPLSENRTQRALAAARATGRLGTGHAQPRPVPRPARGRLCRRRSGAGHHRGPVRSPIPTCGSSSSCRPGYQMQNGTRAVTISGLGRAGAVQRRPLQRQPRELHLPGASGTDRRAGRSWRSRRRSGR